MKKYKKRSHFYKFSSLSHRKSAFFRAIQLRKRETVRIIELV